MGALCTASSRPPLIPLKWELGLQYRIAPLTLVGTLDHIRASDFRVSAIAILVSVLDAPEVAPHLDSGTSAPPRKARLCALGSI